MFQTTNQITPPFIVDLWRLNCPMFDCWLSSIWKKNMVYIELIRASPQGSLNQRMYGGILQETYFLTQIK